MGIFGFGSSKKNKDTMEGVQPQNVGFSGGHLKFAIPYFDVFDPRLTDYGVPVAVHGSVVYSIEDQDLFKSVNGEECTEEAFQQKMKGVLSKYIKGVFVNAPYEEHIPVVQLERRIMELSDLVQAKVSPRVESVLGVKVKSLDIASILIDKDSQGYIELKSLTADLEKENVLARHNASISDFNLRNSLQEDQLRRQQELTLSQQEESQRIQLENQKETMRIQREEMQRAARLQTEQTFLDAHKLDTRVTVLGADTPPPLPASSPEVQYYIAVKGQQAGPFGWEQLENLARQGQLTVRSYVWKQGMTEWDLAGNVNELSSLFKNVMPPLPPKLPSE